jgi:hypothetical protein
LSFNPLDFFNKFIAKDNMPWLEPDTSWKNLHSRQSQAIQLNAHKVERLIAQRGISSEADIPEDWLPNLRRQKMFTQRAPTYFNPDYNTEASKASLKMLQESSDKTLDPRGLVVTTKIERLEDILSNQERYKQLVQRSEEIVQSNNASTSAIIEQQLKKEGVQFSRHSGAGELVGGLIDPSFEAGTRIGEGGKSFGVGGGNTAELNRMAEKEAIRKASKSSLTEELIVGTRLLKGEGFVSAGPLDSHEFLSYAFRGSRTNPVDGSISGLTKGESIRGFHLLVGAKGIDDSIQAAGPGELTSIGKHKPLASLIVDWDPTVRADNFTSMTSSDTQGEIMRQVKKILPAWEEEQMKAFADQGGVELVKKRSETIKASFGGIDEMRPDLLEVSGYADEARLARESLQGSVPTTPIRPSTGAPVRGSQNMLRASRAVSNSVIQGIRGSGSMKQRGARMLLGMMDL